MDTLKNIFAKKKSTSKDEATTESGYDVPIIEVSETRASKRIGEIEPILVKSMDLNSLVDVQEVSAELREGNIIILNISPLMEEDPGELKRAIDQLKNVTNEVGGDVGRLSETRIIATPKLVKIQFRRKG